MKRLLASCTSESGQILVGAIALMLVMAILVGTMVVYTQFEAKHSVKQSQSTFAFHCAEAGVEKGYRAISQSTATWYGLIEHGTQIDRFKMDYLFTDVPGGQYVVSITSGPEDKQATIISYGRDAKGKVIRGLKVIYAQNTMGDIAIQALSGVSVGGGVDVEWGGVVSANSITTGSRTYPQFWSASSLDVDTNPAPPNCDSPDCCQWHSFDQDVPPDPGIDVDFYRSSAQATVGAGCAGVNYGAGASCYYNTPQSWSNFTFTKGSVVFVENNLNLDSPGVDITGTLVVTGNLNTAKGGFGKGNVVMKVPRTAWKQYCHNWAHYKTFDGAAAASFPGLNSSYQSATTLTHDPNPNGKFAVRGFLYVGGSFTTGAFGGGGGGNTYIYGTMFCRGTVTVDSHSGVTVFYNKEAAQAIHTTKLILNRVSWQGIANTPWPSGL